MGWPARCNNFVTEYDKVMNTDPTIRNVMESRKKDIDYVLQNINNLPRVFVRPIEKMFSIYFCFYAYVSSN